MYANDSNVRPSVRGHFTDNPGISPMDASIPLPNRLAPTNAWQALTAFLADVDWATVYRVVARLTIALCFLLNGAATVGYWQAYGLGALQAVAQCLTVLCFLAVTLLTDDANVILLMGGLAILATLAL
jgi:hypothetical protein